MSNSLQDLVQDLLKNPDKIASLERSKSLELARELNRYGIVIPPSADKKSFINFSITNWREQYNRKFLMTALVGFLFRLLEEYEPYEFVQDNHPEIKELIGDAREKKKKELLESGNKNAKIIVEKFLRRNFDYNPDWAYC